MAPMDLVKQIRALLLELLGEGGTGLCLPRQQTLDLRLQRRDGVLGRPFIRAADPAHQHAMGRCQLWRRG